MRTAKATPNREEREEMARVVGLPTLPLALEEVPVLEGPVVPVLVPLLEGLGVELWPEDAGTEELTVGRAA